MLSGWDWGHVGLVEFVDSRVAGIHVYIIDELGELI